MKRHLWIVACLALAPAGCGISKDLYNSTLGELNKLKSDRDADKKGWADAKAKYEEGIASLEKERDGLKTDLATLTGTASKSEAELADTRKRLEELRRQQQLAEERNKQFRNLVAKFKAMVDAGKLKVEIRNGLMLVKLADNILFDPGRTDLKPEGKEALKQVGQILAGITGRKFQIAGHTDNKALGRGGKYKDNWELSTARAVEVLHHMIKEGGLPADRLSAAGFADQLPVATNDTEEGRRQNRRIEIVLLPNIEDLPPLEDQAASP